MGLLFRVNMTSISDFGYTPVDVQVGWRLKKWMSYAFRQRRRGAGEAGMGDEGVSDTLFAPVEGRVGGESEQ